MITENAVRVRAVENLRAWQAAHALALDIYRASESFPEEERHALTARIRRIAAAIPSKVTRACQSLDLADIRSAFASAEGYLSELRSSLELCRELGYLPHAHYAQLMTTAEEVGQVVRELKLHFQPGA